MSEQVIRPSLKFIKAGYTAVVLLIAAAVVAHTQFLKEQPPWLPAVAVLFLIWPIQRHLKRQFIKTSIGEDRLRHEAGFFSKSTRTIQISKIQDVRVDQSLGQRILSVGNLSIETAGETSRLTLQNIDHPQAVADGILDMLQGRSPAGAGQ